MTAVCSSLTRFHTTGRAIVWSGHKEQAELYWTQLDGLRADDGTARALAVCSGWAPW